MTASPGSSALTWALEHFGRAGGELVVGGETVSALAARHGTPAYLYDLGVVRRTIAGLRAALGPGISLHYAAKANPHPAVLRAMVAEGLGFDVASGGELAAVLAAGGDAGHVGFAGPGKRPAELRAAIEAGLGFLSVESPGELERAAALAAELGRTLNVGLRLNPPAAVARAGQRMAGGSRVFGIDTEQVPEVLARIAALPQCRFRGFHVYAGAQMLDAEVVAANLAQTFEVVTALLPHCPEPPAVVNLGGGFGIPYTASDRPLELAAVGEAMRGLLATYRPALPGAELIIELGRGLVGASGLYLSRVIDRKVSRGQVFLVLDGGLHHHLAATGNFGQVIHRPYPICAPAHLDADPETFETVSLAGPLCTPLDTFGAKVSLPPLREGDLVAVLCSGAYGFTASPRGFLSHPEPVEVALP